MASPHRQPPAVTSRALNEQRRRATMLSLTGIAAEALLEATVTVPWERPVHAARLAFLRRVAEAGEVSVHVACGIDRLGFLDVACGLTTFLTDVDGAALEILAQQFAALEERLGPLAGSLQFRRLSVEALVSEGGFPAASVHHLTLQNLFNAHLHRLEAYPHIIDALLTIAVSGASYFLTELEATVLWRQAQVRGMQLRRLGEVPGYYDENVVMLQGLRAPT